MFRLLVWFRRHIIDPIGQVVLRTLIVLRLFATGGCGPQFLSCIGQTNFRHMVCGSREQFDSSHSRLLFKNNLFFEAGVSISPQRWGSDQLHSFHVICGTTFRGLSLPEHGLNPDAWHFDILLMSIKLWLNLCLLKLWQTKLFIIILFGINTKMSHVSCLYFLEDTISLTECDSVPL